MIFQPLIFFCRKNNCGSFSSHSNVLRSPFTRFFYQLTELILSLLKLPLIGYYAHI